MPHARQYVRALFNKLIKIKIIKESTCVLYGDVLASLQIIIYWKLPPPKDCVVVVVVVADTFLSESNELTSTLLSC